MATNLDETPVTGSKWRRCVGVSIQNRYNQTPSITLTEEEVMAVDGMQPIITGNSTYGTLYDPTAQIAMYDPETGAPTGATATMQDAYNILYSLYRQLAAAAAA